MEGLKMVGKLIGAALMTAALASGAQAQEDALCLDCHEPSEDWQGMTAEEILAKAKDAEIKRHGDNQELSDEQLKDMIASLLEEQ
jgi:hypothetical protein